VAVFLFNSVHGVADSAGRRTDRADLESIVRNPCLHAVGPGQPCDLDDREAIGWI